MLKKILFYSKQNGIEDKETIHKEIENIANEMKETKEKIEKKLELIVYNHNEEIKKIEKILDIFEKERNEEIDKIYKSVYSLLIDKIVKKDGIKNEKILNLLDRKK